METNEAGFPATRRNVLRTGALGVGALAGMSAVAPSGAAETSETSAAAPALVEGDIFLRVDGIPGDSTDFKHKDEIQIDSFSWGASQPGGNAGGGGGGAGKVALQDFHFAAPGSKASPLLFVSCATGTHIKKAVLTVRKSGGDNQVEFYKVTLEDCLVSSYQTGGSSQVPSDQFSLDYERLTFSYSPQKADGSLGPPIVVTYP